MSVKIDYNSPAALKEFLEKNGLGMQKKFGQNFLINPNVRTRLVDSLEISKGDDIWEIGPGLGCMTNEILSRGANLTVFEIDKGFINLLNQFFSQEYSESFKIVSGDVLKTWMGEWKQKKPLYLFGNLPYNIAAAIIADTIENGVRFEKCVFTVQKEVAERMTAKPGTENYSSLSVLCNWAYDIKNIIDLSGANFWPRPNVTSRAVLFTKKENFPNCKNPDYFIKMQRALFSSRRKTVQNNLTAFLKNSEKAKDALNEAHINLQARAETLEISQMLCLSDVLCKI